MNITDAIKSGKRFKRHSYAKWHQCSLGCSEGFSRQEVLAEDWEIEEETIQITKSQVLRAIARTIKEKATEKGKVLAFMGPNGVTDPEESYGIQILLDAHHLFLKELGFSQASSKEEGK